ncbi:MAG: S9 family peptidase, partial [Acidobacteriota bacterium]
MRSTTAASWALFFAMLLLAGCGTYLETASSPSAIGIDRPTTPIESVTDTYHDVTVEDPYRWLEDGSDQRVRAWSDGQNNYARKILASLPGIDAVRARVSEILQARLPAYYALDARGGRLFAIRVQPPLEQPQLIVMSSPDAVAAARVIVDPNEIDPSGATTIDWHVPSPDGSLVAVSLSSRGTESGDVHLFETDTGRQLDDVIPRVQGGTAGGDVSWTADGKGLYYTRYPSDGERPAEDMSFFQQAWFHQVGTPVADDSYELGRGFSRIAEIRLQTDSKTDRVLATVQEGDSGRFDFYLRGRDGRWSQIAGHDDQVIQALFAPSGDLLLITRKNAPRGRVLRLPSNARSLADAQQIISEGPDAIVTNFYGPPTMVATDARIYLTYQLGGPSEFRVFDHDGVPKQKPPQPAVAAAGQIVPLAGEIVLFGASSYVEPMTYYRFDPASGRSEKTPLVNRSIVSFDNVEVVREMATSKDGTKIPLNIIRKRNIELDATHPVVMTGYGGFGVSSVPYFSPIRAVWVEQGGVFVDTNLRGGGEFGESWHEQGRLTKKQNVFDDFAACMKHVVGRGYTRPERLALFGGSNGGLLMGAMITQHPSAFRAAVSVVGIYDMLRVELSPNGKFNIPEYGTVENAEQFRALYAYSPYHRVEDGTAYPAVLLMTGENDPRVDPMQS